MNEYLVWTAPVAIVVVVLTALQFKDDRRRRLLERYRIAQSEKSDLQERARMAEAEIERLREENIRLQRWKKRAESLECALVDAKRTEGYASGKRIEQLESYIASSGRGYDWEFLKTAKPGNSSFADRLQEMVESAQFEVLIVSPWIKRAAWERIRPHLERFARRGGSLKVFIRGDPSDFANGMGDDISGEVKSLGGKLIVVPQLHAKLYVVDRREAIVTSANLTRGGIESNCESGVWLVDPGAVEEICQFIYSLISHR
jgi:phosphatidylserine/phosphatidylglycerophosphate/cardiolipin synthase-like enzyme